MATCSEQCCYPESMLGQWPSPKFTGHIPVIVMNVCVTSGGQEAQTLLMRVLHDTWNVQFVKVLNYNMKNKGVGKVSTGEKAILKGFWKDITKKSI